MEYNINYWTGKIQLDCWHVEVQTLFTRDSKGAVEFNEKHEDKTLTIESCEALTDDGYRAAVFYNTIGEFVIMFKLDQVVDKRTKKVNLALIKIIAHEAFHTTVSISKYINDEIGDKHEAYACLHDYIVKCLYEQAEIAIKELYKKKAIGVMEPEC